MSLVCRVAAWITPWVLVPVARAETPNPGLDATLSGLAEALRTCDARGFERYVRFPLDYTEADTAKWTGTRDTYERVAPIRFRDARDLAGACLARAERMPQAEDLADITAAQLSFDEGKAIRHAPARLLTFAETGGTWRLVEVWSAGNPARTTLRDDPSYVVRPGWPAQAPQDLGVPKKDLDQLPVAIDALMRAFDRCDAKALGALVQFPFTVEESYGDPDPEMPAPNPPPARAVYKDAAALARACLLRVALRPTVDAFPGDPTTTAHRAGPAIGLEVRSEGQMTDLWRMRPTPRGWRLIKVFHPSF